MKPRTLSREEEAELARSNKKIKDIHHAKFNEGPRESSPPLGFQNLDSFVRASFKYKLMGEMPGLLLKLSTLVALWKKMMYLTVKVGRMTVRFGKDGFYSKEDLDNVLMRGPWFIGGQFISIRPWEPFFKPSTGNVSLIAVSIRLCELPIEPYEAEVLKEIGESIDINEPLVNTILNGCFEQLVSYEGIQNLCFSCGRLGHKGKEQVVSDEEGLAG
nr:hypothetical protein CFP56_61740 [Quercus suber]